MVLVGPFQLRLFCDPVCAERVGAGYRDVCVEHRDGVHGLCADLLISQEANRHCKSSVQDSGVLGYTIQYTLGNNTKLVEQTKC